MGIHAEPRGDELELPDRRLTFKVATASIRGTVGFTSVAVFADEQARWESRDTAANPAQEAMGSLRPTMATQPHAFEVCSSSPWGTDDYHALLFDAGDTDHQLVSFAETWLANPTISEEQTHALEPDERVWSREYAGQPGATLSAALDPADVHGCYGRSWSGRRVAGFVSTDASSLRGDDFAYIGGFHTDREEFIVSEVGGFDGGDMGQVVDAITVRAQAWGTRTVYGDQREEASLRVLFRDRSIDFESFTWTDTSKDDAMQWLRRSMREGRIIIQSSHERLKRELLTMRARLLPSGRLKYETNGLDYASCLITLAHAHAEPHRPFDLAKWMEAEGYGTPLDPGDITPIYRDPILDARAKEKLRFPINNKGLTHQLLEVPPMLRPILRDWWERAGRPSEGVMFPVRSGQRAGEQRKPASFADHLRRDLKRAFGIEALRPVEMLRANGRRDTRAKWVEVRPLTPREREIFEETEFTRPTEVHCFRRAFKQALANAGVELTQAMALSGATDVKAHQRYLENTSRMRVVPANALPQLDIAHVFIANQHSGQDEKNSVVDQCRRSDLNRRPRAYEVEIYAAGDGDERQESALWTGEYGPDPRVAAVSGLESRSRREAAETALRAYLKAAADVAADALAGNSAANYS